ncbi:hypothetical protein CDAR_82761 [Caerostris darwini]|uniref:Uncharacterized protein n=1 Tax=Caerostris darwini TaxID=1538125 RepID=A0AAV4U898_9ARAC|nr:hypothetical protein CDAR_82761 [Caerostris darwini]
MSRSLSLTNSRINTGRSVQLNLKTHIPTNEDLSCLTRIIYIVKEFPNLFQPLGEIDSLYDKLQNSNRKGGVFSPSKPSNGINNSLPLKPKSLSSSSLFLTIQ